MVGHPGGPDDAAEPADDPAPKRSGFRGRLSGLYGFVVNPGERLGRRTMHAGMWSFNLRMGQRLLTTLRTIILARILAPEDFGLWGIAVLALGLMESLAQTGFRKALIQREGDIGSHLDTAWTAEVIRNTIIALALVALAPFADAMFDTTGASSLVVVAAAAVFINGFVNIAVVQFERDLEFQKRFALEIAPAAMDVAVGIGVAVATGTAWAFGLGMVAASITRVIVSYSMHAYRPRLRLDKAKAKDLFSFGKWVMVYGVILYLLSNLDYYVVGTVLGVAALGLYRMAYTLSQLVATELTTVTSQVAFPAYAKIQSSAERLSRAYLKTLSAISVAAFPVAIGTAILAENIVLVLLGADWAPMITALQILALAGLSRAIAGTSGPLFQAVGRPDVLAKLSFSRLVLLGIIIYPFTVRWGITGAASAILVSSIAVHGFSLQQATRFSRARPSAVVKAIGVPALGAGVMALVVLGVEVLLPSTSSLLSLILLVVVGAVSYGAATLVSTRFLGYDAGGLAPAFLTGRKPSQPSGVDSP